MVRSNDPSSATAATRCVDCNRDGPSPFTAAMVTRRCIHSQLRIFQSSKQPIDNGDCYADTQAPKATVRQGNCQLMVALGYSNCEHQLDDPDYHKEYRTGNNKHCVFRRRRFPRGIGPHKPCDVA